LRSGSGQIIQTKSFKVNLSASSKVQGTVSSTTDGKDDTYIRNPNELSGNISTSNKYDFGYIGKSPFYAEKQDCLRIKNLL
jgi:hypothetical protein